MYPIAAISGVQNASQRFDRASQRLIDFVSGVSREDPAQALADQMRAKAQFSASLAALRAADRMTAQLLDIYA